MALPARRAQFWVDVCRVFTALRGDDDVAFFQCGNVHRVFERGFIFGLRWGNAARIRCGKENRLDQVEVFFGNHAVYQYRADHAAPANQADGVLRVFHLRCPYQKMIFMTRLVWPVGATRRAC